MLTLLARYIRVSLAFITYPGTCLGWRYISMLVVSRVSFSILNPRQRLLFLLIQWKVAGTVIKKVYESLVLTASELSALLGTN